MGSIMIFAAFMVGLGTFMAQMADRMGRCLPPQNASPRKDAVCAAVAQAGGRSIDIPPRRPRAFPNRRPHRRPADRLHGRHRRLVIALNETRPRASASVRRASDYNATSRPPTAPSRPRARGSPWSRSAASSCAMSTQWCCPTRPVGEPARPVVPVAAQALRIRQRPDGAGAVSVFPLPNCRNYKP